MLIGLLGAKGCGKDTVAKHLISQYGFYRIGFADALYQEVSDAFGVTPEFLGNRDTKESPLRELALANCKETGFVSAFCKEKGLNSQDPVDLAEFRSPREILQLWGTEFRRADNDNYWLDIVENILTSNPDNNFVITDVRFPNEATWVAHNNGVLGRILRPVIDQKEAENRASNGTASHPSEVALLTWPVSFTLVNNEGGIEDLYRQLDSFMQVELT